MITPEERDWVYFVVEPVLPVQLRKGAHQQRRVAEIQKAIQEGRDDATISFDFLLAGVHLDRRWQIIKSRVRVGDVVHLVQNTAARFADRTVRVVLPTGECIGFVPEADALPIASEVARGARVEASVKKILADGQYPIPVIGGWVHCSASTLDEQLSDPSWEEAFVERRPSKSTLIAVACLAGVALVGLALLLR